MMKQILFVGLMCVLFCCKQSEEIQDIFLGQGSIVGEVTDHTALLQTRLTGSDTLQSGFLSGIEGYVRFKYFANGDAASSTNTKWEKAVPANDYIVRSKLEGLENNQVYKYHVEFGKDSVQTILSEIKSFKTNPGMNSDEEVSLVVGACMNYYHFYFGKYETGKGYKGADKAEGYPALATITELSPNYFIGAGDNVYFDHPAESGFDKARKAGKNPHPGWFDGKEVKDEEGMRRKYHLQFAQPRFKKMLSGLGTYWLKDDHDYIKNDSDPYMDFPITHEMGIKNFREQLPVVAQGDNEGVTYRTLRMSKDLQIWMLEGRDYRAANKQEDSPDKSIWGLTQKAWLKETLKESDAEYKLIISATPMVGPDDAYKSDNHVNHKGFRMEGDAFFDWLIENEFLDQKLFFVCGDRHWQYHAKHPKGIEEFSVGAMVDNNARVGRVAGDLKSTDPEGLVQQYYVHGTKEQVTGGFLHLTFKRENNVAQAIFTLYDEQGVVNYRVKK